MTSTSILILAVDLEWSDYSWVVYTILGFVGVFYIGFPLLILFQQKFEARPKMVRFDVGSYQWPPEIDRLFTESVDDLEELGFEVIDGLFLPSAVPNVKTALVLLVNPQEMDGAMVTAMYAQPVTTGSLRTLYIEYSTRFDDGTVYDINNSTQMGSFPQRDHQVLYQLVKLKDAESLYRVHQGVMTRDGRSNSQKVIRLDREFGGDAVTFLQNAMGEEFTAAADEGYLSLSADGKHYKPTVKGAFLMVWKELWPWKMIRKMHRNQNAQTLMNELAHQGIVIDA